MVRTNQYLYSEINQNIHPDAVTAGAVFLKISTRARQTALGGAFTAIADDVNSIYYNLAGLAYANEKVKFTTLIILV